MKNNKLLTYLSSAALSLALALGSVACMATGLDLPVELLSLALMCALLAAVIAGLSCLRFGSLICLALGSIFLLNPDFWEELRTVAGKVATLLQLGYGIPIPELLQGPYSKSVLSVLCTVAGIIMVATAWAVQKQKTAIPAVLLSLVPLGCCITVVDTVPSSAALFLWGAGLVLLMMTQGTRHQDPLRGNRLTGLLALPVCLSLLLLFWIVPRDATDRWSIARLPGQITGYFSGSSGPVLEGSSTPTEVNLSALGERPQRQTPVMEVKADFTGPLYLRARDFDEYTGTGWFSTPNRTEELYGFKPDYYLKDGTVEISVRKAQDFYYVPAATQDVLVTTSGQLPNPNLEKTYRFDHCSLQDDWDAVWGSSTSTVNPRYLQLSDETMQGAWAYLDAQEENMSTVLFDLPSKMAAEEIRQLLRSHVPYNLSTPNMPEGESDLALWFLNEAESGYCVHYATTAVVLLRACGIPARYVEGYAISVQKGRTATVRERHAHAWAEYYVNRVGWLVLEATPSGGPAPEVPETTEPTQTQPVTTTAPTAPTAPTQTQANPDKPTKSLPDWVQPLLLSLAGAAAALVLLWGQYRLRRRLFRRAISRGNPNNRALLIYRRLRRLSKWTGHPVDPALLQLAQKARFSNHTLDKRELSQLYGHLKLSESAVSLLPLPKRLLAKWLFARY